MSEEKHFQMSVHQVNVTEISDKVQKSKTGNWIEFGEKNTFYDEILEMFDKSNMHRSIAIGLSQRYAGHGLTIPEQINEVHKSQIKRLFKKTTLDKIAMDTALFSRYALLVTTNKAGTKIVRVEHYPVAKLRPDEMDEEGIINGYWYAKDWSEVRKSKEKPRYIPSFDTSRSLQIGEFIHVVTAYDPDGNEYLNKPSYNGAINWIKCDIEISKYHLSNILHGFSGGLIIKFTDDPGKEDRERIERAVRQRLTGSTGDKIVFLYGTDGEKPEFETIDLPDADKKYETLDKIIEQKIIIGHRLTSPMLIGIKSNTGLGNNADEIKTANELLEKTSVSPVHNFIIGGVHELLRWNGISGDVLKNIQIEPLELIDEEKNVDKTQLSDDRFKILSDEDQDYVLDYLNDRGDSEEDLLNEGFEIIDEQDCEGDDELKIKGEKIKDQTELATAWGLTPNNLSRYDIRHPDGEGVWLVRYQYALADRFSPPAIISTSRKFCREMIDAARNGNRVYKREVLENLSNPEFGGYKIFWYKGSYNCRHVWKRKIYFKPADAKSIDEVRNVGAVPYVTSRLNDKRATRANRRAN